MHHTLKAFNRDSSGNIATLFAIGAVPMLLAAGVAIDYIRLNDARTELQAALDGAALAAALPADKTDAERIEIGEQYFASNFTNPAIENPDVSIVIGETTVTASADFDLPTSLMKLANIDNMDLAESAEVVRPFEGEAEVVLVLDYSGSMNSKQKYQNMRDAATGMIDALDAALADDKLKIGLVPFSAMVYTSMSKDYVTQSSASATWTGCTQDRAYPHNTNVDTPTADNATKWGYFDNNFENKGNYGCNAYGNKKLKIVPLTTDLSDVKAKLSNMMPLGNTNIPLGAEFGWNLLDPQEPYAEGASYSDANTRKFLILLTDGVQTSKEWGSGGSRSVANGQQNLLTLCDGMRDDGITVFSIAYDINDPDVTTLLTECAPGRYYEPDAGADEITAVFNEITSQIKNQIARVTK